jgi:16S rRNA A1518/A1519 N6-dimethyltransferase RsmA/KsgA/DIM1 with predicted DNA glycosylase/AP lyase activity
MVSFDYFGAVLSFVAVLHELQLDVVEYLLQPASCLVRKLQLCQYKMLELLKEAFFPSNLVVVNVPFYVAVSLLLHVVRKAHTVLLEIGKGHRLV